MEVLCLWSQSQGGFSLAWLKGKDPGRPIRHALKEHLMWTFPTKSSSMLYAIQREIYICKRAVIRDLKISVFNRNCICFYYYYYYSTLFPKYTSQETLLYSGKHSKYIYLQSGCKRFNYLKIFLWTKGDWTCTSESPLYPSLSGTWLLFNDTL